MTERPPIDPKDDEPSRFRVPRSGSRAEVESTEIIKGAKPGLHYAYRVDGPTDEESLRKFGHRYNRNKVLIDPYALGNTATLWDRGAACGPREC